MTVQAGEQGQLISIVIPVYNESKYLGGLLQKFLINLREKKIENCEIIIVENGSSDNTLDILSSFKKQDNKIKIITMDTPNYGRAIRQGMLSATGWSIINFDLDLLEVSFIERSLPLLKGKYDIVIGSKNSLLSEDRRSWIRKMISQGYRFVLLALFGLRYSDTHGMKAWKNTDTLQNLICETRFNGNIFDSELIIRAKNSYLKIIEVPISVSEKRPSTTNIARRILEASINLSKLWWQINFREKLCLRTRT